MNLLPWIAALALVFVLLAGCGSIEPATEAKAPRKQARAAADAVPASIATDLLLQAIGGHRLVLVGELHGTRETPALVADAVEHLLADGDAVVLALEISLAEQPAIDAYLASPGTRADRAALLASPHWTDPMHDGRDSAAMLDLIERVRVLRADGGDMTLALFDPGDVAERDRGMADRLRALAAEHAHARMVVLIGNMHATIAAPASLADEDGRRIEPPMTAGRYLRDLDPFSINVHAGAGESVACTQMVCRVQSLGAQAAGTMPRLERSPPGEPWHAFLILPVFTASPPAQVP